MNGLQGILNDEFQNLFGRGTISFDTNQLQLGLVVPESLSLIDPMSATQFCGEPMAFFSRRPCATFYQVGLLRYSGISSVQFTSVNCHMRYNMEARNEAWIKMSWSAMDMYGFSTSCCWQICFLLNSIAQIKDGCQLLECQQNIENQRKYTKCVIFKAVCLHLRMNIYHIDMHTMCTKLDSTGTTGLAFDSRFPMFVYKILSTGTCWWFRV